MSLHNNSAKSININNEVSLSQYITTQICHDLAGTIGALGNALEFTESANVEIRAKALNLLKLSASESANRLIFFRKAYGLGQNIGETHLEEIKTIASNYLTQTKISLHFDEQSIANTVISPSIASLILCMIHHSCLNLIHGGSIRILVEKPENKTVVYVIAEGRGLIIDNQKIDIINDNTADFTMKEKNSISIFANKFAKSLNVKLTSNVSQTDKIEYIISIDNNLHTNP